MELANNYHTTTHLHYQNYYENDGFEALPVAVKDQTSGYAKDMTNNKNIVSRNKVESNFYLWSEFIIDSQIIF